MCAFLCAFWPKYVRIFVRLLAKICARLCAFWKFLMCAFLCAFWPKYVRIRVKNYWTLWAGQKNRKDVFECSLILWSTFFLVDFSSQKSCKYKLNISKIPETSVHPICNIKNNWSRDEASQCCCVLPDFVWVSHFM